MQEKVKTSSVLDLESEDWGTQVLKSTQLIIVDFWHDSCVWCKRLEPELEAVAGEFSGKLRFARLNIFSSEGNTEIGRKYGIMGTPTLLLFCNGRPIDSLVGYKPRDVLRRELQEKVDEAKDCFEHSTSL